MRCVPKYAKQNKEEMDLDQRNVIELFDEQAAKYADKPALSANGKTYTYRELQAATIRTARQLQKMGVQPDTVVPVEVDRSAESIIRILGILRAGAAYLPVDVLLPADRIRYMTEKVGAALTLHLGETLPEPDSEETAVFHCRGNSRSAAYVMFTSGSEGMPKGVVVEDRGIIRLVRETDYFPFSDRLTFMQSGTLCFDASTFDVFGALLNGATLCMIEKETLLDPVLLKQALLRQKVDSMFLTTPLFHQLVTTDPACLDSLQNLIVGGDILYTEDAVGFKQRYPHVRLFNGYGPTENTSFSLVYEIDGTETGNIPIGKPIANSSCFILDAQGKPVQPGEKGELYVGGEGVARGYIADEARTNDKFIPNPFGDGMLYKTGDLAYESGGNVMFCGRIDSQVKIRGFRIELDEIQKTMLEHAFVKECFLLCETIDGEKTLAAFIVYRPDGTEAELLSYLRKKMPEYMLPSVFVKLEKMPLNLNGKVDKPALRRILQERTVPEVHSDEITALLSRHLKQAVQNDDRLYEIGMNSLTAIRLYSDLKKAGYPASLKDILSARTVYELKTTLQSRISR